MRNRIEDLGVLQINQACLEIRAKYDRRVKSIRLRLSARDGQVMLTMPWGASLQQGRRFVESARDWLAEALQNATEAIPFVEGAVLPLFGHERRLSFEESVTKHIWVEESEIRLSGPAEQWTDLFEQWVRAQARVKFTELARAYAKALGLEKRLSRVSVRETKSQWGSCTEGGNLSFSWRLAFAPPEIMTYVVAHEVAHLKELNHSRAFWDLVNEVLPDYKDHRVWLKSHGPTLFQYGRT